MEGSSSSFTDLLNSSNTSPNPENPSTQHQSFPPTQLPMNYPPPQIPPGFHPQYTYPFNPYGGQPNYPQFSSTHGGYVSPYQGYMGQYPQAGSEMSPFGYMPYSVGSREGNNSCGDESNLIDPSSPVSIAQKIPPESFCLVCL